MTRAPSQQDAFPWLLKNRIKGTADSKVPKHILWGTGQPKFWIPIPAFAQEDKTLKAVLRVVDAMAEDPEYRFRASAKFGFGFLSLCFHSQSGLLLSMSAIGLQSSGICCSTTKESLRIDTVYCSNPMSMGIMILPRIVHKRVNNMDRVHSTNKPPALVPFTQKNS